LLAKNLRISVFARSLVSQGPSVATTYGEEAEPVRNPG
jgi:hypothetical protein